MLYLREPVRFHDRLHVQEFLDALRSAEHTPAILIVDTLAASVAGGNEDKSADMTVLIDGIKIVQRETGCAAVVVHHTGWDTTRERGSSSLRAAMDVVLALRPLGSGIIELKVEKMRDAEIPAPFSLKLRKTISPSGVRSAAPERLAMAFEQVSPKLFSVLNALSGQQPLPDAAWKDRGGVPKTTFYREKGIAITRGLVSASSGGFQLTDAGLAVIQSQSHGTGWDSHETGANSSPKSPHPVRDGTLGLSLAGGNGTGPELISDKRELLRTHGSTAVGQTEPWQRFATPSASSQTPHRYGAVRFRRSFLSRHAFARCWLGAVAGETFGRGVSASRARAHPAIVVHACRRGRVPSHVDTFTSGSS